MKLSITVDLDNAAFEDDLHAELARVLSEIANAHEFGALGDGMIRVVLDVNGNAVCEYFTTRN